MPGAREVDHLLGCGMKPFQYRDRAPSNTQRAFGFRRTRWYFEVEAARGVVQSDQ